MYSKLIPFETIVEGIKDDTGITNIRNLYQRIRRLIFRCERDIGWGRSLLLKRITYSIENETIITDGEEYRVRLPEDIVFVEEVGMCKEGLCPGDYHIQGNWIFLCKPIEKFSFIYYALYCDGEGNPAVPLNHLEAVITGVTHYLYRPKRFNDKGSASTYKEMKNEYEDRCAEARGDDAIPDTAKEWSKISNLLNMSSTDILFYSESERCWCCLPESLNTTKKENDSLVYYWQFGENGNGIDLITDINFAPFIDQLFLDLQNSSELIEFTNGKTINYNEIGRIGFAIKNCQENQYSIYDYFETNITDIVFYKYYNVDMQMQIFISKTHYSHGTIFFKLKEN